MDQARGPRRAARPRLHAALFRYWARRNSRRSRTPPLSLSLPSNPEQMTHYIQGSY